jgi:hypothetical protein
LRSGPTPNEPSGLGRLDHDRGAELQIALHDEIDLHRGDFIL